MRRIEDTNWFSEFSDPTLRRARSTSWSMVEGTSARGLRASDAAGAVGCVGITGRRLPAAASRGVVGINSTMCGCEANLRRP